MSLKSKAETHEEISRNFVDSWNHGPDADVPLFLAQFSPSIEWHDHAFQVLHKGIDCLAPFRRRWLTAIKGFHADIKSVRVIDDGAVLQCLYRGTMVGKVISKEASGRSFAVNVLVLIGIDGDGKIEKVDEYYTATFDEAQDIDTYRLSGQPPHAAGKT